MVVRISDKKKNYSKVTKLLVKPNTNKLSPQERLSTLSPTSVSSNNTNKLSPQELFFFQQQRAVGSNNTNKLSPQELSFWIRNIIYSSNNTNKLSPQEHLYFSKYSQKVQIIQINLVLKNTNYKYVTGYVFK